MNYIIQTLSMHFCDNLNKPQIGASTVYIGLKASVEIIGDAKTQGRHI